MSVNHDVGLSSIQWRAVRGKRAATRRHEQPCNEPFGRKAPVTVRLVAQDESNNYKTEQ